MICFASAVRRCSESRTASGAAYIPSTFRADYTTPMTIVGKPQGDAPGECMSPLQGSRMSPRWGYHMSPLQGSRMSPLQGSRMSPLQGSRMSPLQGSRMSPLQGSRMSPRWGYHMSPRWGYHMSPLQGSRMSPLASARVHLALDNIHRRTPINNTSLHPLCALCEINDNPTACFIWCYNNANCNL
jgi:hypothetical protein